MKNRLYALILFPLLSFFLILISTPSKAQVLFDNGPYFNSVGTGFAGANESVLYTTTFGMGTIGFGHQQIAFNRVADDFVNPNCNWRIDSIVFFGYQTGSPLTSTFTGVNFRIWDSIPDAAGSVIVFGDTTTNRLTSSVFSGAYRVTETTTGNSTRPIMRNTCNLGGIVLPGGTFWLDWASAGSLASGPWAPARTPVGQNVTGNGRQRIGSVWNNALDGGTGTPAQGFPFIVYGTILDPVADAGSDQSMCPGSSVMIGGAPTGSGGQGALSILWSPGMGLSDSLIANPNASPNLTTDYIVAVTDTTGCIAYDTVNIVVGTISANFLYPDTTICPGDSILLDAGAASSWSWNTGDTTQTIYVMGGTWSVAKADTIGCVSMDTITVNTAATVQISGDTSICPLDTVALMTNILNASYLWSTTDTTDTIYVTAGGTYSVTATTNGGCISMDSITIIQNNLPVAAFTFVPAGGGVVNFTDASTDATGWNWTFGDGGNDNANNPSHTYLSNGSYQVCLTSSNICGSDSVCDSLTICPDSPVAGFTSSSVLLNVSFTNTSTNGINYHWDFGDGNTSNSVTPSHTYGADGSYYVCLTAYNLCGDSSVSCDSVTVSPAAIGMPHSSVEHELYPNPTNGILHLQVFSESGDGSFEFTIIGLDGKILSAMPCRFNESMEIDLSNYPDGLYLYRITNEGSSIGWGKIVVAD